MNKCGESKQCYYKSGYSPMYDEYVEIVSHCHDRDGGVVYRCRLRGDNRIILFRPFELTNLVI